MVDTNLTVHVDADATDAKEEIEELKEAIEALDEAIENFKNGEIRIDVETDADVTFSE